MKNNKPITQRLTEDKAGYAQDTFDVTRRLSIKEDIIGTLSIPTINLKNAPVKEYRNEKILENYLGHLPSSSYFDGNVVIFGHRTEGAHFFQELYKLKPGDKVTYTTQYTTRTYEVSNIKTIQDTEFSILKNTRNNQLTLFTCVEGNDRKRLCVTAVEI